MLTKISSATTWGITTHHVVVEVDLSFGMMQFHIVGLPDVAIRESRQRIATALKQCGIRLPDRKITVNLAPADLKKEGTLFDLPIAFGILHAAGIIKVDEAFLNKTLVLGELSLDGSVRPVKGILSIAADASLFGKTRLVVAVENAQEAAVIQGLEVIPVAHLSDLVAYVQHEKVIMPMHAAPVLAGEPSYSYDLSDIKGQMLAKRATQIAAAGRHNMVIVGSPGSGKTMLAKRMVPLLPPMDFHEIIETSKIYSISGKLPHEGLVRERPFRSPHHTISAVGLVGGGTVPQPGEISLAHNGILFLDEFTEFKQHTIDALRQPLESREVRIVRAQYALSYPASFLLVAALNPCPCGFLTDKRRECNCSAESVKRYLGRVSGPMLDRICLQVGVASMGYDEAHSEAAGLSSQHAAYSIDTAVALQRQRYEEQRSHAVWNGLLGPRDIDAVCTVTDAGRIVIKQAFDRLRLTMRGYHKLLKVARTIADLEGSAMIDAIHIQEAMGYRVIDALLGRSV